MTDNKTGVENGKWHTSMKLRNDLGLIDDPVRDNVYQLTERGKAVYATWQSLRETPIVTGMAGDNRDVGVAALHLLSHHFDAEGFPDEFDARLVDEIHSNFGEQSCPNRW